MSKPESEFHWDGKRYMPYCKPCRAERDRERKLRTSYGITTAQYDRLLEIQRGVCAICGFPPSGLTRGGKRLVVDHDHACCPGPTSCGRCIRGLLCHSCNNGIGRMKDIPERLRRAAEYIEHGPLDVWLLLGEDIEQ